VDGQVTVTVEEPHRVPEPSTGWLITRPGFLFVLGAVVLSFFLGGASMMTGVKVLVVLIILGEVAWLWFKARPRDPDAPGWHQLVEGRPLLFTVLLLFAVLAGGIAQLIPTIFAPSAVPWTGEKQQPYSPLELAGRDVYTREGCYVCHSQMIRTLQGDTQRYGGFSRPEEFIYDHPFQWGSKRTGPDLQKEGGRYPNLWHYSHMMDPRSTSPGSNMPSFAWTADYKIDLSLLRRKMIALQKVGVPYSNLEVDSARDGYRKQADLIVTDLAKEGVTVPWDREIVALIGYLQRLGRGPQVPAPLPTAAAPTGAAGGR
jgi:cytochrome c oxidase cbb3-type subunit I/II